MTSTDTVSRFAASFAPAPGVVIQAGLVGGRDVIATIHTCDTCGGRLAHAGNGLGYMIHANGDDLIRCWA